MYKKVVKFSYTQQKIFWVLVFSIRIWYLAYPTDRSMILAFLTTKNLIIPILFIAGPGELTADLWTFGFT